ncbi:DUF1150 family protein [Camelimonas abortus]|uniref:DUF1150 family protein n=1 Tax=Camelimonas abortus TaxID=1017184 RepID=A0ABV7LEK7_9HYPH
MTRPEFPQPPAERVAYVRPIRSEDVQRLFPQAPALQPGMQLFALLMGDGTPIMVTDTRDAALANAWANDLTTVSVH